MGWPVTAIFTKTAHGIAAGIYFLLSFIYTIDREYLAVHTFLCVVAQPQVLDVFASVFLSTALAKSSAQNKA